MEKAGDFGEMKVLLLSSLAKKAPHAAGLFFSADRPLHQAYLNLHSTFEVNVFVVRVQNR
jgi:hypothetical protein